MLRLLLATGLLAASAPSAKAENEQLVHSAIILQTYSKHCSNPAITDVQKAMLIRIVSREKNINALDAFVFLDVASDMYAAAEGITESNLPFCKRVAPIVEKLPS